MLRALEPDTLRCWDHGLPSIRFLPVPGQTFKEDYVGVRCPGVSEDAHAHGEPSAACCPVARGWLVLSYGLVE